MITCTRRLTFAAGHRVWKHESKCANLHGHNYAVLLEALINPEKVKIPTQKDLDSIGRVIDFSVMKKKFGGWIEKWWDHGFILHREDAVAIAAIKSVKGSKLWIMNQNPTAENMAIFILEELGPILLRGTGVQLRKVTLWETENCFAEVTKAKVAE